MWIKQAQKAQQNTVPTEHVELFQAVMSELKQVQGSLAHMSTCLSGGKAQSLPGSQASMRAACAKINADLVKGCMTEFAALVSDVSENEALQTNSNRVGVAAATA